MPAMADLMQQARELLAAELAKSGLEAAAYEVESSAHRDDELEAYDIAAIRSIAAAMRAAPAGFVLVPGEVLRMMVGCAYPSAPHDGRLRLSGFDRD